MTEILNYQKDLNCKPKKGHILKSIASKKLARKLSKKTYKIKL